MVERVLSKLAQRHDIAMPSSAVIDAALSEHPDCDLKSAMADLEGWTRREAPKSLAAVLRRVLVAAPSLPAQQPPVTVAAASEEDQETWRTAREQLRTSVATDAFDLHIEPMELAGVDGHALVFTVPGRPDFVRERFTRKLTAALDGRAYRVVEAQAKSRDGGLEQAAA